MKTLLLLTAAVVAGVLCSCAGLPPPENEGNCLVVGYLADDYPDAFFDRGPRTIVHGMTLRLTNLTQNRKFTARTNGGYFYFLSNGTDEYQLESYEYQIEQSGAKYSSGGNLRWKFKAAPGKILYLGHATVVNKDLRQVKEAPDGRTHTFHYAQSRDLQWKDDEMLGFVRDRDAKGSWLGYPLVRQVW